MTGTAQRGLRDDNPRGKVARIVVRVEPKRERERERREERKRKMPRERCDNDQVVERGKAGVEGKANGRSNFGRTLSHCR